MKGSDTFLLDTLEWTALAYLSMFRVKTSKGERVTTG